MGIDFSFCCSEAYFRPQKLPKEDACYGKVSIVAWIDKIIKQTYLLRTKRMQKKNKEGQQQKMGKQLTLEEWLLNSPIMEKDGNCNGGHCGLMHRCDSNFPSVARESTYFSDSMEYLSLEQQFNGGDSTALPSENPLKDEMFGVKEMGFNSLTRSQSSKVKKRVRFRLPEVSETIILHPLEMDFEEC